MDQKPPSEIKFHRRSQVLELVFDERRFELSAEYLRVFSPSAEVKGHGPNQAVLQLNKENAQMISVVPQGNYAIRITFADGHDSGIYTWSYLFELGDQHVEKWTAYKLKVNERILLNTP